MMEFFSDAIKVCQIPLKFQQHFSDLLIAEFLRIVIQHASGSLLHGTDRCLLLFHLIDAQL